MNKPHNTNSDTTDPYPLAPATIVHPMVDYLQRAREYVAREKREKREKGEKGEKRNEKEEKDSIARPTGRTTIFPYRNQIARIEL